MIQRKTEMATPKEKLNFVCMKWGTFYGPEYVNNLYRMIKRNVTVPFRLVCYTERKEGIDKNVEIFPLPPFDAAKRVKNTRAYGKKTLARGDLKPFKKGERFLYLDLDVVIMGNLEAFFKYETDKDFIITYNWTRGKGKIGNSSVTLFRVGPLQYIVDDMEKNLEKRMKEYKSASQEYLSAMVIKKYGKLTFWPDEWVRSFQIHSMPAKWLRLFKAPIEPKGCKILVFHGAVNPPDAIAGVWPRKVPLWKKWYKTVRPTPWLKKYWK